MSSLDVKDRALQGFAYSRCLRSMSEIGHFRALPTADVFARCQRYNTSGLCLQQMSSLDVKDRALHGFAYSRCLRSMSKIGHFMALPTADDFARCQRYGTSWLCLQQMSSLDVKDITLQGFAYSRCLRSMSEIGHFRVLPTADVFARCQRYDTSGLYLQQMSSLDVKDITLQGFTHSRCLRSMSKIWHFMALPTADVFTRCQRYDTSGLCLLQMSSLDVKDIALQGFTYSRCLRSMSKI